MTAPFGEFGEQNPGDGGFDWNQFTAEQLENPRQKLLRGEFEQLRGHNELALSNFDPELPSCEERIELGRGLRAEEEEESEAVFADSLRNGMLQGLGLSFVRGGKLEPPAESNGIVVEYKDGAQRLDYARTPTGVVVPVATDASRDAKRGLQVDKVRLLSKDRAEELHVRLQEVKDDSRLLDEFGFDGQFVDNLQENGISAEDKHAMLVAFDRLNNLEVSQFEYPDLTKLRTKLLKAMMPGTQKVQGLRGKQLPGRVDKYTSAVEAAIIECSRQGFAPEYEDTILQTERLWRLQGLNRQLTFHRRAATLGSFSMGTLGTASFAGAGNLLGRMHESGIVNPVSGTIVCGLAGLAVSVERIVRLHRRTQWTAKGFTERGEVGVMLSLSEQLQQEQQIAEKYIPQLRPY